MTHKRLRLGFGVLIAVVVLAPRSGAAEPLSGPEKPKADAPVIAEKALVGFDAVLFGDLLARPTAYVDRKVRFDAYFAGQAEFYRPFYTRFIQGDYTNFATWPLGMRLWIPEERAQAVPSFYVSRERKEELTRIETFALYGRISVYGRVVSAHGNLPWIDVYAVRPVPELHYTEKKLRQMEFAMRRAEARDHKLAAETFRKVLALGLPTEGTALVQADLGRAHFELGEYEAAVAALEASESLRPEDAPLAMLLARARLKSDLHEKAAASARKVLRLDPNNADAYALLGLALGELGQHEEGLTACDKALRLVPMHPMALRNKGYLLAKGGHLKKAIATYNQAIDALATDPSFHEELGHLYIRAAQYADAMREFRNVETLDPEASAGYRLQGEVLHRYAFEWTFKDKKPTPEDRFTEAYRRAPKEFVTVLAFGRYYADVCGEDAGKRGRAEKLLDEATRLAPEDVELLWEYIALLQGDTPNLRVKMPTIVKAYERLVALTPEDAKAWMNLGLARWELAEPELDGAAEAFAKAREFGPDYPEAWLHSGRLAGHRHAYPAAKEFLIRARDLKPENARTLFRVHMVLSDALANLGEVAACCQELDAALEASKALPKDDIDRDSTVAKNNLAYFLTEIGDLERAVKLGREVVKEKPGNLAYLDTRGWALFKSGDVDAAFPDLLKAAGASPSVEGYYHLAEALLARGEIDEAHATAKRATKEYEEEAGLHSKWIELNAQRATELEARLAALIAERKRAEQRRQAATRTDLPDAPQSGTPIEPRASEETHNDAPAPDVRLGPGRPTE